jgi:hypothetical protein
MGDFPGFPFRRLCIHIGMALPLRLPPSILNLPENTLDTDLGAIFAVQAAIHWAHQLLCQPLYATLLPSPAVRDTSPVLTTTDPLL